MGNIGIILVVVWVIIGVLSPIIGYTVDKIKKTNDKDAKFSTGYSDMRISTVLVLMYSLPLLFVGIVLNYFKI